MKRSLKTEKQPPKIVLDATEPPKVPTPAVPLSRIIYEPSFCIKTSAKYLKDYGEEQRDLYINFCSSDSVDNFQSHLHGPCKHPSHFEPETPDDDHDHNHSHSHGHHHHHHTEAAKPKVETTGSVDDKTKDYFEIPYVVDMTYKDSNHKIYTITFGPKTIRRSAHGDLQFRDILIQTALQAIVEKFDEELSKGSLPPPCLLGTFFSFLLP